ncbi:hypothetical protein [Novosphingobium sp. FKTRR1]|uniref:hypothetical protein n=1 Tax=Novosphingobium sp. FKTRR1 TaxID=2879118 RepID=UPI001CF0CBAC|nr:hypothetical protein [Novosphingobium sp. FKTRR1]
MTRFNRIALLLAGGAMVCAQGVCAQSVQAQPAAVAAAVAGTEAAAVTPPVTSSVAGPVAAPAPALAPDGLEAIPSTEGLVAPKLDFTATPQDEADFDKYFYFHRANTSFADAYADIRECDALASGSSIYLGGNAGTAAAAAQYGVLPAAIGGAIGSLVADAIFGSAARRQQRRVNMRNCMGFKQYQRFGLTHDLWSAFNFEEGMGRKREGVRNEALALQALVASGPAPTTKELGL